MTVLIGMPASGKTTVCKLYEEIYGEQVYDTDAVIENLHGNIGKIFAEYGEEYFRQLETEVIRKILDRGDAGLISTGGGTVLREENARLLKEYGKIVYLKADLETLLKRLDGDTSRPLLSGNVRERLTELFSERTPIYERVADIIIDTDGLTPREILEKI